MRKVQTIAMQEVVGSSPISRSESPCNLCIPYSVPLDVLTISTPKDTLRHNGGADPRGSRRGRFENRFTTGISRPLELMTSAFASDALEVAARDSATDAARRP